MQSFSFSFFFSFSSACILSRRIRCNITYYMGCTAHTVGGGVLGSKDTNRFHAFKLIYSIAFLNATLQISGPISHAHLKRHANPVVHTSCTWLHACTANTSVCPPFTIPAFHSPHSAADLPSLPLIRLGVLEREPTRPLIRTSLPANPTIAASKQNTPQRDCS